jgi:type I restriction enzyme S subunit
MKREIPKLKDYCIKISSGGTPRRDSNEYFENGTIPWVKSKELKSNIILETEEKITLQGLKNSSTKLYPIDTVLLAMYGVNIGQVGYLGIEATINQAICGIVTNKKILDPKYLYYYLSSIPSYFDSVSFGAAQQNINQDLIKNLKIEVPDILTQQRIASIISAYDDLIEVNSQRIKLLEETARELYKEWFVRMRFPATADRPGYKKAKFVKGVPEGWEVKELKDFGKIHTGKTPPTKVREYYGGEIPFIKTPDLHKNQFIFETEEYLTEKGNNTQKRSCLPKGSICVSCIGTGGIVGLTTAEKSQTNQQINSLIPANKKYTEFLYYAICDLKETIELFGGTGATMTNLSKGKFEKLKILFANNVLVDKYNSLVSPLFKQIQILQQQNTQLRQIRDRLLPRLISGKLEVKEK